MNRKPLRIVVCFGVLAICGISLALATGIFNHSSRIGAVQKKIVTSLSPTRNDYFVFAQGCVPIPSDNGVSCTNPPEVDWQNPLAVLRDSLCMTENEFRPWSTTRVKFVKARSADYRPVRQAIATLNAMGGDLFLIGHSAGGAAIASYLIAQMRKTIPMTPVRAAILLDTPLAQENLMQLWAARWAAFDQADQVPDLGSWANTNKIDLRVISYADDWAINPIGPLERISLDILPHNSGFHAGPWELMLKHNYVWFDLGGAHQILGPLFAAAKCPP